MGLGPCSTEQGLCSSVTRYWVKKRGDWSPVSRCMGFGVYSMNKTGGGRKMLLTTDKVTSWVSRCSSPSQVPVLGGKSVDNYSIRDLAILAAVTSYDSIYGLRTLANALKGITMLYFIHFYNFITPKNILASTLLIFYSCVTCAWLWIVEIF